MSHQKGNKVYVDNEKRRMTRPDGIEWCDGCGHNSWRTVDKQKRQYKCRHCGKVRGHKAVAA